MDKELKLKLEQLRDRLERIEEEYKKAVRSHKTYNTLRSLRDEINSVKKQLQQLEKIENENGQQKIWFPVIFILPKKDLFGKNYSYFLHAIVVSW